YPAEWKRLQREGHYYYRAPGGESYPDVALRIHSFLSSMRQNFAGRKLLVITHGNAIWAFRRLLERLDEPSLRELQQDPAHEVRNCAVLVYSRRQPPTAGHPPMKLNRGPHICYADIGG